MKTSIKQQLNNFTASPAVTAWTNDLSTMTDDSVRILNATSVAAMRTTALSLRFTSITIETLNVGLGYALDHTPKTYEETKESMSSIMDNLLDMFDDEGNEIEPEVTEAPKKATFGQKQS